MAQVRCHASGHWTAVEEIVLGLGSREGQVCQACAKRLRIPYKDSITGEQFLFGKDSEILGNMKNKRGLHLRGRR